MKPVDWTGFQLNSFPLLYHGPVSPDPFSFHPVPAVFPDDPYGFPPEIILILENLIGFLFIHDLPEFRPVPDPQFDDLLFQFQVIPAETAVGLGKITEIAHKDRGEFFGFRSAEAQPALDIFLHPFADLAFLRCGIHGIGLLCQ